MSSSLGDTNGSSLIRQLAAGDVAAFTIIYKKYFRKVLHFVYQYALDSEDAEELVQDVFVQLWKKRETIDEDKNLDVLLYVISRNLVIDRLRKHAAIERQLHVLYYSSQHAAQQQATEQLVHFQELKENLDRFIEALPAKRKAIFILSREKGLTYKEIAETLNLSQGTVEKQMSKALHTLKDLLAVQYKIPFSIPILITFLMVLQSF